MTDPTIPESLTNPPALPDILPPLPDYIRAEMDPRRLAQWDQTADQWPNWTDDQRRKMWPRILAVRRNNIHEALDALQQRAENEYAAALLENYAREGVTPSARRRRELLNGAP